MVGTDDDQVETAKVFYGETLGVTFDAFNTGEDQSYWVAMSGGMPAWASWI